jgi:hypothetical protein
VDLYHRTYQLRTIFHYPQTHAVDARHFPRETTAAVGDRQAHFTSFLVQGDSHRFRVPVLDRVPDRFLRDTI